MGDDLKQRVLDTIQSGFPLELDPYGVLAVELGAARDEVKDAVYDLCIDGSVRRIGASFDSRKLGYTATLCALAVPGGEAELLSAAELVSLNPGVTHNYGRANRDNLWFTLITRSENHKKAILECIKCCTGCSDLLDMPATRTFKISVDFGAQRAAKLNGGRVPGGADGAHRARGGKQGDSASALRAAAERPFDANDPFDVELVRWSQDDVARDAHGELIDEPYAAGAAHLRDALGRDDIAPEDIVVRLRELKADGTLRRFGAMVRHQRIGFAHNSMTVWDIPDECADRAGELFATMPFVSHCYIRPRQATWPANLYGMTHAQSAEELEANISALRSALEEVNIPCNEHFALETTAEYKKVSMRYFSEPAVSAGGCMCDKVATLIA